MREIKEKEYKEYREAKIECEEKEKELKKEKHVSKRLAKDMTEKVIIVRKDVKREWLGWLIFDIAISIASSIVLCWIYFIERNKIY